MAKVTGLGGVFIQAGDPKFLARWYEDHLGIPFGTHVYASLKWRNQNKPEEVCTTAFSMFPTPANYFLPSEKSLMINFRVENLAELLKALEEEGIPALKPMEEYDYGKFCWVMDPEGNKIELWEPVESGFGESAQTVPVSGAVEGLGGVFIKSKDPVALSKWYEKNFEIPFHGGNHIFKWLHQHQPAKEGSTVFAFFKESTTYFQPSEKSYMLNFIVSDLNTLLSDLKSSHVEVDPKKEDHDYGSFGWIMDPDGNKIELWQAKG